MVGSLAPLLPPTDPDQLHINSAPVLKNKKEDEHEQSKIWARSYNSRQFDSNELDDIKQRINVVRDLVLNSHSKFELILPNVYKIIIDICEEAKLLREKKEVQEVRELLSELLNQIDAKLQNAEKELRELNASFKKLAFNTLIDVDPQVLEEDKMDIINQFNAIVNKVNEVNKRNAQFLSSSSGQKVNPIKVEGKVESTPGARPSEFMENVVTAYDNVKEEQEIGNDYYKSFSNPKDAQKLEEKNKSLERSKGVHLGLEEDEPTRRQEQRGSTLEKDENSIPQSNLPNISIPQKREGKSYTINAEGADLRKLIRPNRAPPNVPTVPTQGFSYTPPQKPVNKDNTAGEEIQEQVKYNVINISPDILGIVKQEAEKYPDPPKTYEDYRQFLLDHELHEYVSSSGVDENDDGECDYFYSWYRILSGNELPESGFYGEVYTDLKSYFSPKEKEDINVLLSLYQSTYESNTSESIDFQKMIENRNSYALLILLMAIRDRLLDNLFRRDVNFGDLFYTFINSLELSESFFEPVLEKGKKKRGYKGVIEKIEKESLFHASEKYKDLFQETSKNLVQKLLKRFNFVY